MPVAIPASITNSNVHVPAAVPVSKHDANIHLKMEQICISAAWNLVLSSLIAVLASEGSAVICSLL